HGTNGASCRGGRGWRTGSPWSRTTKPSGACWRSEEHTSELQSRENLVCRLLLEKKKKKKHNRTIMRYKSREKKTRLLGHTLYPEFVNVDNFDRSRNYLAETVISSNLYDRRIVVV